MAGDVLRALHILDVTKARCRYKKRALIPDPQYVALQKLR